MVHDDYVVTHDQPISKIDDVASYLIPPETELAEFELALEG